jgi:hypothetical protein
MQDARCHHSKAGAKALNAWRCRGAARGRLPGAHAGGAARGRLALPRARALPPPRSRERCVLARAATSGKGIDTSTSFTLNLKTHRGRRWTGRGPAHGYAPRVLHALARAARADRTTPISADAAPGRGLGTLRRGRRMAPFVPLFAAAALPNEDRKIYDVRQASWLENSH